MVEGQFESLKVIHAVTRGFVANPFAWGQYRQEGLDTYFLLAEFREVGEQPRSPIELKIRVSHGEIRLPHQYLSRDIDSDDKHLGRLLGNPVPQSFGT